MPLPPPRPPLTPHRLRLPLVLLALVVLGAMLVPSASAGTRGTLRTCEGCALSASALARYDYVVLHSNQAALAKKVKAISPRTKVLVYKNAVASYSWAQSSGRDWGRMPGGIGYVAAQTEHPEWFLHDTYGRPIEFVDYRGMWLMDFGNADYRRAWLAAVAADVRAHGWDGVVIDDVNVTQRIHLGGRTIAKYPTADAQREAMHGFLRTVGPALKEQGVLVFPNIFVEWPDGPAIWSQWIAHTSGAMQEYFTKWGAGRSSHFTGEDWDYRQRFLKITQDAGKRYLGVAYAPADDVRSMRYARASFLIDWNGGRSALLFDSGSGDPWHPAWTIGVGAPSGPKARVGAAWRRTFARGIVVVNPSNSTVTVPLGGSYRDERGATVTSVTLSPATGAILRSLRG